MESIRQKQVGELLLRNFSSVLQQEGSYIYGREALVTVTQVKVASDLQLAKIYVSIYNVEDKNTVLLLLRENESRLKQMMISRVRNHLRRMPSFEYFMDETLDEMYRVEEMFQRLEANKVISSSDKIEEK